MKRAIERLLGGDDIRPVLLDIGASGEPPRIWDPVAGWATYIGFDPDRRELHDVPDGRYARAVVVNQAVTSVSGQHEVGFYLTHSPFCSSSLPPDTVALADYLFSNLFVVESEVSVPAATLASVLAGLGVETIDWFKTDSQGTDLRLFNSLPDRVRAGVLAVDMEPGLIDAYHGEDLFVDVHRDLVRQGFWLSALDVQGAVRMRRTTLAALAAESSPLRERQIAAAARPSPGWCEARYLRKPGHLIESASDRRAYLLLWVFALLDRQPGFALDLALEYRQRFGADTAFTALWEEPQRQLRRVTARSAWAACKPLVPGSLRSFVRGLRRRVF